MKPAFRNKLLLLLVDKVFLGLIAGGALLYGQYVVSHALERYRGEVAYRQAIAEARIAGLKDSWTSVHRYGVTLADALRGQDTDYAKLAPVAEEFDRTLPALGVFVGVHRVEEIKDRIGGPFLARLTDAVRRGDHDQTRDALSKFQEDWFLILGQLEKELGTPPSGH